MPYFTDAKDLEAVRARNRAAASRPRSRGAFPLLQQPDLQRGEYIRRLQVEYVHKAEALLRRKLAPVLEQLAVDYQLRQEAEARADAWRVDATREEDVRDVFQDMARQFLGDMPNARVAELARSTAWETSAFHRAQLRQAFRSHLSVDVDELFKEERGLRREVDDFTVENVKLIRTVSASYFAEVEALVLEAVSKGTRPEKLAELIEERTGVAKSNAARIARDQVGKFHGQLNRTRQQALGVKRYRWRTMRDNRVRAEHVHLSGEVFSWDKPPSEGHPGHAINCRCWAEPVIDDVLAEEITQAASGESNTPEPVPRQPESWQRLGRVRTQQPRAPRAPRPPPTPRAPRHMLPHGPVRGDGAQVLSRHPKLAELLGDKLRVDGMEGDGNFEVREHVRGLADLPEGLLSHMQPRVGDIHIGTRPVTELGRSGAQARLKSMTPDNGAGDFDAVGGIFDPEHREVLVAATNLSGSASTAVHEFGHAVDYLAREDGRQASSEPEFQAAWVAFKAGGYRATSNPYFTMPWPRGSEETFAEAFAHYYKWGEESATLMFGPEVVGYIRKHYGREAWAKTRPGRKTR